MGLRIRRLGVRIPSGALCVETEDEGPDSGNAVGAFALSGLLTGRPRRSQSGSPENEAVRVVRSQSR